MKLKFMALLSVLLLLFVSGCGSSDSGSDSGGSVPSVPTVPDVYTVSITGVPNDNVSFTGDNATSPAIRVVAAKNGQPAAGITLRISSESVNDSTNPNIMPSEKGKLNMTIRQGNNNMNIGGTFSWTSNTASDGRPTNISNQPYDLTFIEYLGQRSITFKAEVLVNNQPVDEATKTISFGKGPITEFKLTPESDSVKTFDNAEDMCAATGLPSFSQFEVIVKSGAFDRAGWPQGTYWQDDDSRYYPNGTPHNDASSFGGGVEIGTSTTDYDNFYIVCKSE